MEKFEFEIWNMPDTKIGQLHRVILEKCPTLAKNATGEFISGDTGRVEFEADCNDLKRLDELTELSNYFFEAEIRVKVTNAKGYSWIESYHDGVFEEYDD